MLVNVIRRAVEDDVRFGSIETLGSHATRIKVQPSKLTAVSSPKHIVAWLREQNGYWSVAQVARLLKKHPETVYGLISEDDLPAVKDRRRWKIDPKRLADWLEARGFSHLTLSQIATRPRKGGIAESQGDFGASGL
jgi:excisionase family DNA binding protein